MKKIFVLCLFGFSALFAHQSLYISDFHYLQDRDNKENLQVKEISDRVYLAAEKLATQNKSGIVPVKGDNLVAIYADKKDMLKIASELTKLKDNNYILAKDEFGNNALLIPNLQIETARAKARELIDLGFDAKAIINNQRVFYYDNYFANCNAAHPKKSTNATYQTEFFQEQGVVARKKRAKKRARISNDPLECDIVAKMKDKTFYNPQTGVFVINGVEYNELPKEFVDCNVSFIDANLHGSKFVNFTTDENKTITGELEFPKGGILDDNFFYTPEANVTKAKKLEVKRVVCNFDINNGIKVRLNEDPQIKREFDHLPSSYVGEVELFYEDRGSFVEVSNSGYAKIRITKEQFKNHCKKVKQ